MMVDESRVGKEIPEPFKAKAGFWSSLVRVARSILTQLGKSAEDGNYYVYAVSRRDPKDQVGNSYGLDE